MGEWPQTTLGEVTDFLSGGTPSKGRPDYWDGSIPWVSAKDMKRFRLEDTEDHVTEEGAANGTKVVPAGTVLLLARGMTLLNDVPICVLRRPMAFNQDVKALRPSPHVRADFLPYLLLGHRERLLSLVDLAGHGTGRLNSDELKALDILLPSEPEQRGIAHILGTLDDKIELNRRMSETLEAMSRAVFKSWFVDFDPVRAKAEGRDPGLPKQVADVFPARLVESELGKIPEGWSVTTIGNHMLNFDSQRVPVSGAERAKRQGPYPYHGAAGVMDHVDDYLFDGIHLLVGEDGSVVREAGLAVTQYVWGKIWVNNHAHVIQGKGAVSTEQLLLHFHFEPVEAYVTGAVQPKLSQGRMNLMPFLFAGESVCRAFATVVQPWFARLRANADATKTLAILRDTLLPKLISGELRIRGHKTIPGVGQREVDCDARMQP